MNKILRITSLILSIFIILSSCKRDEVKITTTDEYYVKYAIKGNGTYNYFNKFSVNTDKGNVSFGGNQYRSWNQTYGPVRKGFRASVTSDGLVTIEIFISKNNGPFALKASKSGSQSSVSYTIDF
jgi:hypothetical protein